MIIGKPEYQKKVFGNIYLFGGQNKWKHLFIWGTKIAVTGPDDIFIGFQEKHELILNKKLQMVKRIKKEK